MGPHDDVTPVSRAQAPAVARALLADAHGEVAPGWGFVCSPPMPCTWPPADGPCDVAWYGGTMAVDTGPGLVDACWTVGGCGRVVLSGGALRLDSQPTRGERSPVGVRPLSRDEVVVQGQLDDASSAVLGAAGATDVGWIRATYSLWWDTNRGLFTIDPEDHAAFLSWLEDPSPGPRGIARIVDLLRRATGRHPDQIPTCATCGLPLSESAGNTFCRRCGSTLPD